MAFPASNRTEHPARGHNSFDALRYVFALAVILSHSYALQKLPDPLQLATASHYDLGKLGVTGFFAISGFLVTGSWRRDPSMLRFALARVLRVFPAFLAALLFSTLIAAIATPSAFDFLSSPVTWRWVWRNAILIWNEFGTSMPGAFEQNPLPGGANGSLWTLTYELRCYAAVAVLGITTILARRFSFCVVVGVLILYFFKAVFDSNLAFRLVYYDLYLAFITGMMIAVVGYRPLLATLGCVALIAALCPAFGMSAYHAWFGALQIALAAAIVKLANSPLLSRATFRAGDYSYGLYVYAFPLQQLIIAWLADRADPLLVCALTIAATAPIAILSWHAVESAPLRWLRGIATRIPPRRVTVINLSVWATIGASDLFRRCTGQRFNRSGWRKERCSAPCSDTRVGMLALIHLGDRRRQG